jgi:hypothetical protein
MAGSNDILCPGFLVPEFVIITSEAAGPDEGPERPAKTPVRKPEGIALAP